MYMSMLTMAFLAMVVIFIFLFFILFKFYFWLQIFCLHSLHILECFCSAAIAKVGTRAHHDTFRRPTRGCRILLNITLGNNIGRHNPSSILKIPNLDIRVLSEDEFAKS